MDDVEKYLELGPGIPGTLLLFSSNQHVGCVLDHFCVVKLTAPPGGRYSDMCQTFNINVFLVGVNGVKPDFKVVSACLDTREETRSELQRVSRPAEFVCECRLTGS